jgi:hypothetical protein
MCCLLPCSLKSFFLLLLENAIAKEKKNPLKLGASSEARKEIQAWWTLQRTKSLYKQVPQALNGLNKKKMATQQKQDSMRLAEIHKVSFFTHKLVSTTTTALFMPRKKLEREVYREKEREGKGNVFHQWTYWVGGLAKDSQKFAAAFVFSRASKRAS